MTVVAVALGLVAFRVSCVAVFRRRGRSRFWWELNRWRAALAVEDDPGPWRL